MDYLAFAAHAAAMPLKFCSNVGESGTYRHCQHDTRRGVARVGST
jgi:hypothetical protein